MNKKELKVALQKIGLALNVVNNTVTTDVVGVEPDDTRWRINHDEEIALLDEINNAFFSNDICCEYVDHNKSP